LQKTQRSARHYAGSLADLREVRELKVPFRQNGGLFMIITPGRAGIPDDPAWLDAARDRLES
jgi:hypothetical protein